MTRVAVVDLGTNSTRLLVADVEGPKVQELDRRLTITRLGEGVDERRRLLPVAVARVRNALADYRRAAEKLGAERTLAIATSAVRDAENGEAFLGEIEWSYGFATRLLSGEEEAQLAFRGASSDGGLADGTLLVDVGGGSTELVLGGQNGIGFHTSLDLGCVRLTERFLHTDPPGRHELEGCAAFVAEALAGRVPASVEVRAAVGVAGTITTLAAIDLGLEREDPERIHGHCLGTTWIRSVLDRLAQMTLSERRGVPGLHPERAAVIVAGVVVVLETLRRFGLESLEVSERDIMHGAALWAAELPAPEEGGAPPGAYTCC